MITVYEDDINKYGHKIKKPVGRFDPDKATLVEGIKKWDGNNMTDVHVGHGRYQDLYRTARGQYVLKTRSSWVGDDPVTYRFAAPDEARLWLIRNGDPDLVEEWFGEDWEQEADERSPGRREIGAPFPVRLPEDLRQDLERVRRDGEPLAETIRRMIRHGVEQDLAARTHVYRIETTDDGGQTWYPETDEARGREVAAPGQTAEALARMILTGRVCDLDGEGPRMLRCVVWRGTEEGPVEDAAAVVLWQTPA